MRLSIAVVVVVAASPAGAQPAPGPQPRRCEVTIARAPDDVRSVIEAWVRAEPRCTTALELRVVPTDGGLYLFARDDAGRIHERVVPDAQSAGVLVASWIADDRVARPPARPMIEGTPAPAAATPAPALAGGPPITTEPVRGPGEVAPIAAAPRVDVAASSKRSAWHAGRWLTLGGMVQVDGAGGGGVRGDFEVWKRGGWALGIGLAGSTSDIHLDVGGTPDQPPTQVYVNTVDIRAVATAARTIERGRWQLRLQGGFGVVRTISEGTVDGTSHSGSAAVPVGELSVLVSREVFGDWAIGAGPVFTIYAQKMSSSDMDVVIYRDADLMAFAGLRKQL